jgi:hypothetical protein
VAAGTAQEDRRLVVDQLAAEAGEDGRAAGETCPRLLVGLGGGSSDETVVCQHSGADRGAAGSDGLTQAGAVVKSSPGTQWCLKKLIRQVINADVQDSGRGRLRAIRTIPERKNALEGLCGRLIDVQSRASEDKMEIPTR